MEKSWIESHKEAIQEELSGLNGMMFLRHRRNNPKDTAGLVDKVRDLVAESGMSVSAAKGFFDYMKIVAEERSCIISLEE